MDAVDVVGAVGAEDVEDSFGCACVIHSRSRPCSSRSLCRVYVTQSFEIMYPFSLVAVVSGVMVSEVVVSASSLGFGVESGLDVSVTSGLGVGTTSGFEEGIPVVAH